MEENLSLARIISAITAVMPCEKCPYPCEKKGQSSQYNCNRHWFEVLSECSIPEKWITVSDDLFKLRRDEYMDGKRNE